MLTNNYDIAVIGGGPAGIMAAFTAASHGASVIVLEKMATCGRKLLISGSGRCNITNTVKDTKQFVARIKNGKFLYQAVNAFGTEDIVKFFQANGLKTTVENGMKVFPATGGSDDVLRILMRNAASAGAEFLCRAEVSEIVRTDKGFRITHGAGEISAKAVVIASGGKSYPATGSAGGGFILAESLGHAVITPKPVLVPVYAENEWLKELQGLSLRDIRLTLYPSKIGASGDLVFTDKGISGPAVYDLSRMEQSGDSIGIDMMPGKSFETLDSELEQLLKDNNKKLVRSIIDSMLQPKLVQPAFSYTGVDGELRASNLSRKDRQKLVSFIKDLRLTNIKFAGFERAVVTSGGVDTREIDGRTMQSKLVPGLFFAGEVMDVDGPTGGFNLQICWSTGRLSGKSCADYVKSG